MAGIVSVFFIWIVAEVYCTERIFQNFRCNNGKYIENYEFCNGENNCGDSSDELFGCGRQNCGNGNFQCNNERTCIPISSRCNTIKDCPEDDSDESGCEAETNIDNCSLHTGKYLCQDKLKCLDFSYTCDGVCNCFDCSDETYHCKQTDSCSTCLHYCLRSPTGPHCVCNSSNYKTSKLCRDWFENMVIYSTATKIKMIHIRNNHVEIIQNDVNCTVLTVAKNYLYYATNRGNKERILKTSIINKKTEMIIELDLSIQSLAVDWISNNLYFTSNQSLLVCSNDGRICTVLKCCAIDYVALAPKTGLMFYTQNIEGDDEQVIMKSNMDGSEETALLDMSIQDSIFLTVDEWSKTVYWIEMKMAKLHSTSFNGLNKKEYSSREWHSATHFSVLGRHLFFTKKHDNTIYMNEDMHQYHHSLKRLTDINTNIIRQLFTYNSSLQLTYEIDNPCENSSCDGLCLLRSDPFTNSLNYTCVRENFIPYKINPLSSDHTVRPVLQFKSSAKREMQIDSTTKPSSKSMKAEPLAVTKAPIIYAAVYSPAPQTSSRENHSTVGIFNVMSCAAFAFSILMLYLFIRHNYLAKHRQRVDIVQQIEL